MYTFSWLPSMVLMFLMAGFMTCRANECDGGGANGCDFHGSSPLISKERFRTACNRHDVCYDCGASYGIDRATCDLELRHGMREVCEKAYMDAENGTDQNLVKEHRQVFINLCRDESLEGELAKYGLESPIHIGDISHSLAEIVARQWVNHAYDRMNEQNENNEIVGMVSDETNENFSNDLDLMTCCVYTQFFYTYVNTTGGSRYRTSPASYCQDLFVPGCLPSGQ